MIYLFRTDIVINLIRSVSNNCIDYSIFKKITEKNQLNYDDDINIQN